MIRVGILSFSDGRARVHDTLCAYIGECQAHLRRTLEATGEVEVLAEQEQIHDNASAADAAQRMCALRPDACVLNVPVFAFPNFAAIAARVLGDTPLLAIAPENGLYPGLGGLQAAVGFIRQSGGQCEKLWGNIAEPGILARAMAFLRGARALSGLRGQVFGLVGGRSIGMGTGTAAPDTWLRDFGVDIDHIDQYELVRRAQQVPPEETTRALAWLEARVARIAYDGDKLTPETLGMQINCYIALKQLIAERGLSFVGVKCHYEMSEYFVTQCLSAALCNDPYDWDGEKQPVVFACEADADAALTMQVLKLATGKPVVFMDFRHYLREDQLFAFCNCGACATWYAARSDDPAENLKQVTLCPIIGKYGGGGCHVQFIAQAGEMTFARLTHRMDKYVLQVFEGEFHALPVERLQETCPQWPHGFASVPGDPMALLDRFASNHIHAVHGHYADALAAFCALAGIEMENLTYCV